MPKFNVGDRVRIINQNKDPLTGDGYNGGEISPLVVGLIVTLRKFNEIDGYWHVNEDTAGDRYVFDERALELVAPPKEETVAVLRKKASALKIRNYSRMKKPALLLAVKASVPVEKKVEPPKETLGEKLKKSFGPGSGGVCRYALSYSWDVVLNDHGACHASFQATYGGGVIEEACDNIAYHLDSDVDKEDHEAYKRYVKWILNDSGVKDMFLTKDIGEALRMLSTTTWRSPRPGWLGAPCCFVR